MTNSTHAIDDAPRVFLKQSKRRKTSPVTLVQQNVEPGNFIWLNPEQIEGVLDELSLRKQNIAIRKSGLSKRNMSAEDISEQQAFEALFLFEEVWPAPTKH